MVSLGINEVHKHQYGYYVFSMTTSNVFPMEKLLFANLNSSFTMLVFYTLKIIFTITKKVLSNSEDWIIIELSVLEY